MYMSMIIAGVISLAVSVSAWMVGYSHLARHLARREPLATNASISVVVRTVHTVTQWTDHASALVDTMAQCETQSILSAMYSPYYTCTFFYSCDQLCPDGTYGFYCSGLCGCQNNGVCSHMDGSCTCLDGWRGAFCELACDSGFYGDRCRQECFCLNGAACDHVSGTCTCTDGWLGDNCSEPCVVSLIVT